MAQRQAFAVLQQLSTLFGAGTGVGLDDCELLERFVQTRDEAAFTALVARHGPLVLGACRRLLSNPADVEDAFQATFLVLVEKARSLREQRFLGTWLYKVAYRVALRARSEADRHRRIAAERMTLAPPDHLEWQELRAAIDEEILRLPTRYRQPVVLCYLEGLSHEEAARRLGCPLGTVNSRLASARERLRMRLYRRGLSHSEMLVGGLALREVVDVAAAVPTALRQLTLSAALQVASGRAVAATTGATVSVLTRGVLRAMTTSKMKLALAAAIAAGLAVAGLGFVPRRAPGAPPSPPSSQPPASSQPQPAARPDQPAMGEDSTVPVIGIVRMPDGLPAVGASVEATNPTGEPAINARTDNAGSFRLRGVFPHASCLRASSADGTLQTMRVVSSGSVRTAFAAPIELTLAPAVAHAVVVRSDGRPVSGARVAAGGQRFRVRGITGRDGKATLWHPATERIFSVVAWHPDLGISSAAERDLEASPPPRTTQLALLAPGAHTIRVVDVDGKGIGGLDLSLVVRTADKQWIVLDGVREADVRTNPSGTAAVPWMPRENLDLVNVEINSPDWNVTAIDRERLSERLTTVHARRKGLVEGRLLLPAGASSEGVLISGEGSGENLGHDRTYARARRDGTFALRVVANYKYELQIDDTHWASEMWSGIAVREDTGKPAQIRMSAYPATPLTIHVTRGPMHVPVANAWVIVLSFKDSKLFSKRWLWTDGRGVARTGVGRGEQRVLLRLDPWTDEWTSQVTSPEPLEVEFHRPWQGERHLSGRLLEHGVRYTPSPALVALAWTPHEAGPPLTFKPQLRRDGTFEVAWDAAALSVLFLDPERKRSGFAQVGLADSPVELKMVPTATYSGTLLDEQAQPLAGRSVQLNVKAARQAVLPARQTDSAGRFRFEGVPAGVPLKVVIQNESAGPQYDIWPLDERFFEPGEVRVNDEVRPRRTDPPTPAVPKSATLAERVKSLCRNVRPSGMHGLVILQGHESGNVVSATVHLLDYTRVPVVLKYLPMRVGAVQIKAEAASLAAYGWPIPAAGEIVLVALKGDGSTLAARRIATDRSGAAAELGQAFLEENQPAGRDAPTVFNSAREEARKSGRRVWVVYGGTRCQPCLELGRWMEDHHATLDKDFVVAHLMEGVDQGVGDVIAQLPWKTGDGIPWFAITEPDGTVVTTSVGPLGNIGLPGSVESVRHFRKILESTVRRLDSQDVDRLIRSLAP